MHNTGTCKIKLVSGNYLVNQCDTTLDDGNNEHVLSKRYVKFIV